MQLVETEWILRGETLPRPQADTVAAPAGPDEISVLVSRLLEIRGLHGAESVDRFLHPRLQDLADPFLLPEMSPAVERIFEAIDAGERVVLYGDYDVDGITSVTLLHEVLKAYGLEEVETFLPHRIQDGYGLTKSGLERALGHGQADLLVAVDCGTTSLEEAEWLRAQKIDLVVLDHHELASAGRPDCVALVNPKAGDEFHYLCSAGIVFKVAHALLKTRPLEQFKLREFLDLVALGTVADIVPLVDENRILVRKGLQEMERTRNTGIAALKSVAGLDRRLTSLDIGFRLGPRLNAAGRLDNAREALELLLTRDASRARNIAMRLEQSNRERQRVEKKISEEAAAMIAEDIAGEQAPAIIVGSRDWHPGVIGIVASRIVKRHHRPALVVAFDEDGIGKGSGRSVEGVSLVEALDACRDLLLGGGGHEMAAGLTIEEDKFPEFCRRFVEHIAGTASPEALRPKLLLDAEARLEDLTLELLDSYELLQPFGKHNEQPLFFCRGVQLAAEPRVLKEKHLKLQLLQKGVRREAMYFGGAEVQLPRPPWDIAFKIDRNLYRGQLSLSIFIEAVRAAEAT